MPEKKTDNIWSYKQIRKFSWDTVFKKGLKSWLLLVMVCFAFSFLGALNVLQESGIEVVYNAFDNLVGYNDEEYEQNVDYLKHYVSDSKLFKDSSEETKDSVGKAVDAAASSNSWLIRALAANATYFERNPGEVIANLLLISLVVFVIKFFFQNVISVGLYRYFMENRQQKEVRVRRVFSPFHLKTLPNVIWVMFRYYLSITLWTCLFVIPGIYKGYQYGMVPYILAENPGIKWKEARKLSSEMTHGYKWKMLLCDLSYSYIWILQLIPVVGLLVSIPLNEQLNAEYYFVLRNRADIPTEHLTEKAFADAPYVKKAKSLKKNKAATIPAPSYILTDVNTKTAHKEGKFRFNYSPTDIVFMFFSFCLIGWIWEVGYEFINSRNLVNRGTMYGPWIPIYGFGGLAIVVLLDRFKDSKIKLFGMTMIVCAVLEYLASFALEFIFNSSYWDYKKMFMNVNGRICLAGLLAFGIGGLFGVYIAGPAISRFVNRFSKKKQIIVMSVLVALFVTDVICCAIFGFNTGAGVGGKLN